MQTMQAGRQAGSNQGRGGRPEQAAKWLADKQPSKERPSIFKGLLLLGLAAGRFICLAIDL